MVSKLRLLGALVSISLLFGCDGSTTGGGGTARNANFNVSSYVGDWFGQINGPNVSITARDWIKIEPSGSITIPDADPACPDGLAGKVINSNPFNWTTNFECFVPGAGICRISETGTMRFSGGNRILGEYQQTGTCGVWAESVFNRGDFVYERRFF